MQCAPRLLVLMGFGLWLIVEADVCKDEHENCERYKETGECWNKRYEGWMRTKCARTCELCEVKVNMCRDVFRPAMCAVFASSGLCQNKAQEKWARARCAKTCRFCQCTDWPYGCCDDRKTLADGPRKKGCAMKLCADNIICDKYKNYCDTTFQKMKDFLMENCPFFCGFCKAPSPRLRCEQNHPSEICCWNGEVVTHPSNCPACVDGYLHACRLWKSECDKQNFWKVRNFLESCPKSCGQCHQENEEIDYSGLKKIA